MIFLDRFSFELDVSTRRFACRVRHPELPEELHFNCEGSALPICGTPTANWAVMSLLWTAMSLGEDIEVGHCVSDDLLHTIHNDLQSLLLNYHPQLKRIRVQAFEVSCGGWNGNGIAATGFSAGVDSFATLALYRRPEVPTDQRIECITLHDVGSMGPKSRSDTIFRQYAARAARFAESAGLNWISIDSNLDDFMQMPNSDFIKTHTLRNVAAAYVFEDHFSTYHYSSAVTYEQVNKGNRSTGLIDPMLLPLMSTRAMRLVSSGAGLSRSEKTRLIATDTNAMQLLDVCVGRVEHRAKAAKPNCGTCWKCSRTLVTLDALGVVDRFDAVFDLAAYRRNKYKAIRYIFVGQLRKSPLDQDLMRFLRARNFHLGSSTAMTLRARVFMLRDWVRRQLRRRYVA